MVLRNISIILVLILAFTTVSFGKGEEGTELSFSGQEDWDSWSSWIVRAGKSDKGNPAIRTGLSPSDEFHFNNLLKQKKHKSLIKASALIAGDPDDNEFDEAEAEALFSLLKEYVNNEERQILDGIEYSLTIFELTNLLSVIEVFDALESDVFKLMTRARDSAEFRYQIEENSDFQRTDKEDLAKILGDITWFVGHLKELELEGHGKRQCTFIDDVNLEKGLADLGITDSAMVDLESAVKGSGFLSSDLKKKNPWAYSLGVVLLAEDPNLFDDPRFLVAQCFIPKSIAASYVTISKK